MIHKPKLFWVTPSFWSLQISLTLNKNPHFFQNFGSSNLKILRCCASMRITKWVMNIPQPETHSSFATWKWNQIATQKGSPIIIWIGIFRGSFCRVVSGKVSSYVLCTISFRWWFVEFLISITFPNNCQELRTTRPSGKILGWVRVAGAKESARKSSTSCRSPRKSHFFHGNPKVSLVHTFWRIERL